MLPVVYGLVYGFFTTLHTFPSFMVIVRDENEACRQRQQTKKSVFRFQRQTKIESVYGFVHPEVVVHAGKGGKIVSSSKAVIHRKHGTEVINAAFLWVVGKPKQLSGKRILEAAIHGLVGHL